MTGSSAFTPDEWKVVLEGPPSAGLIVITAQRGGTFRETISMAKAYTEARQSHGASELLDEIVSAKPHVDHTRYSSPRNSSRRAWSAPRRGRAARGQGDAGGGRGSQRSVVTLAERSLNAIARAEESAAE